MAVILPIAVWGLLWRVFIRQGQEWREAVIRGSLVWATLLVVITESLSLFHVLLPVTVALTWGFLCMFIFAFDYHTGPARRTPSDTTRSKFEWALIAIIALVVVMTGITALVAPPNTWDSMTYHMTRVAFWAQNHSVDVYPTTNLRQLTYQPFAEYTILHFYLLAGGDQFANLVQWLSMLGSVIVVSLIARDLGAKRQGQLWAAACCALIPMGLLQATSTQNDYVVTFWILCLTALILRAAQNRLGLYSNIWIGLSIGLALYTKATGYVFGLPLLIAFGLICLWQWRVRFWQPLILAGVLALAINAPLYIRNLQGFGSPMGAAEAQNDNLNAVISVPSVLSNAVRGVAMHLMIAPNRLDQTLKFQERVQQGVESFHSLIGFSASDTRTTFNNQTFAVPVWNTNEDLAGNPIHLLAFGLAVLLYIGTPALRKNRWIAFFLLLLLGDFVVFCLIMRWNIWLSRYQLTFFPLMAVLIGVALERWRSLIAILLLMMLPLSLGVILLNDNRAWVGENSIFTLPRERQYFVEARQLGTEMRQAADLMYKAGCTEVGIGVGGDQWVYPLFGMLNDRAATRIEYVGFDAYPLGDFTPCGLIVYNTFDPGRYETVGEAHYVEQGRNSLFFYVYLQAKEESR